MCIDVSCPNYYSKGSFNIKILFIQYRNTQYKDYKNPLHLDVVDPIPVTNGG